MCLPELLSFLHNECFYSCYQNDDEAERAQRRRTLGKSPAASSSMSNERLDEEQQGLKKCLQIFHDNVS